MKKIKMILECSALIFMASIWHYNCNAQDVYWHVKTCAVNYEDNSTDIQIYKIKSCFDYYEISQIRHFEIVTPTFPENDAANNQLWNNRVSIIKKKLNLLYPNTSIGIKEGQFENNGNLTVNVAAFISADKPLSLITAGVGESSHARSLANSNQNDIQKFQQRKTKLEQTKEIEKKLENNDNIEKIIEKVMEKKVIKYVKSTDLKIWGGAEFLYAVGNFSDYFSQLSNGYLLGVSQSLMEINPLDKLYVAIITDFTNTQKTVNLNGEIDNSIYYLLNLQIQTGIEHFIVPNEFSVYGDVGPVLEQRAFMITTNSGAVNNYNIYTTLALGINSGINYYQNLSSRFDFVGKLNLNVVAGLPKTTSVYSTAGKVEEVNTNPIFLVPSISIGIKI